MVLVLGVSEIEADEVCLICIFVVIFGFGFVRIRCRRKYLFGKSKSGGLQELC